MDFHEWEPYYLRILREFGYDRRKDEEAAQMLSSLLPERRTQPSALGRALRGRVVTVLGNAPRLSEEMGFAKGTVIAADEAVSVALDSGLSPEFVVTDLDGRIEDIQSANVQGSTVVVHAHGDNMEALGRWAGGFSRNSLGTTQSRPFAGIHNFGGFTDGDRGVFLAEHFGASEIRLLGFDFERPNPKDRALEVKRRKLAWAKELIGILQQRVPILFPASSNLG